MTKLGVIFTGDRPPEELGAFAVQTESAGLDELWLWEDCFLAGGIASSATALAATERIVVGLGVMPAVFRNPVACAMEIATLAREANPRAPAVLWLPWDAGSRTLGPAITLIGGFQNPNATRNPRDPLLRFQPALHIIAAPSLRVGSFAKFVNVALKARNLIDGVASLDG